jgi:starch phosphorylase
MHLSPQFNCQRMVGEYMSQLYDPAYESFVQVAQNHFQPARERAVWNQKVQSAWSSVGFVELGPGPEESVFTGRPIPMRAVVRLDGLEPSDVRVEAVVGRVGVNGHLEETQVMTLPAVEQKDGAWIFAKEFVPHQTGRLGYSLRISPNHCDDPLMRPCNSLLKWSLDQG